MDKIFPKKYLPKEKKQWYSFAIFSGILIFLFLVDLLTKILIFKAFDNKGYLIYPADGSSPYTTKSFTAIPGLFDMTITFNNGAAWNMLANQKWFLSTISLIASIVLIYVFILYFTKLNKIFKTAIVLMFAGCFGNLIDRMGFWANSGIYKYGVIDFIQFHFWKSFPVFNFADSYLVIGLVLLVIAYILSFVKQNKTPVSEDKNLTDNKKEDLLNKLKEKEKQDE